MNIYFSLNVWTESFGTDETTRTHVEFEGNHYYEFSNNEWAILPVCYKVVDGERQMIDDDRFGVVKLEPSHLNKYMLIVK